MLLNNKIKKLPRITGGGGNLFFKCKLSPITRSGDRSVMSTAKYNVNSKYSAFSLIELSIVLIIMGLLVAGITGGASLVETAKLTSVKREIDDHVRDVLVFYGRVGRLPGDLDNTGRIGYKGGGSISTPTTFSNPYNMGGIAVVFFPFIELYLHGISSFQPYPDQMMFIERDFIRGEPNSDARYCIEFGGLPSSKAYKNFAYLHRYLAEDSDNSNDDSNSYIFGLSNKMAIQAFMVVENVYGESNKKTVDIAKKMDIKFDDGAHNGGSMRAFCINMSNYDNVGKTKYADADTCSEIISLFDVK
jgi:hypothetical protein